jgi:hypothetical protein
MTTTFNLLIGTNEYKSYFLELARTIPFSTNPPWAFIIAGLTNSIAFPPIISRTSSCG